MSATSKKNSGPGYLKAAAKSGGNAAVLGASIVGCGIAAQMTGQPELLALIPCIEGVFLAIKSHLPGFRKTIDDRKKAELRQAHDERVRKELALLSPNQRAIYLELKSLTEKTLACYARLPSGGLLLASSETQLTGMLDVFLKLLNALNGYRRYLSATDRAQIEKELAVLRTEISGMTPEQELDPVNRIKARRVSLLEERLSKFDKAITGRELISHQLASIEDFLRLFHDQALTLRDPDMATMQIESLTQQLETTDETMRSLEGFSAVTEEFAALDPMESLPSIQVR